MNTAHTKLASWGRWPVATVRLLRVGRGYWVRVRGVGDFCFCLVDVRGAVLFAERMAERYYIIEEE